VGDCENLSEAVVACHTFPNDYPAPEALVLAFQMGDHHLITHGGVRDQPAGELAAAREARYIWDILDAERDRPKDMSAADALTPSQYIALAGDPAIEGDEGLRGIRKKIRAKHAASEK
jgi:hypothetical protein